MQITSSYGVEIKKQNIPIRHTLRIYRSAVSYLVQVYAESWEELSQIDNIQKRFNAAEHLVHETKKNRAKYDFDLRFPRLPSYLRRSAIQHALGSVSSYETRLGLWERGKLTGKKGIVYGHRASVCLETQKYPDTPNKPEWPSALLKPGEKYDSHCIYRFSVKK